MMETTHTGTFVTIEREWEATIFGTGHGGFYIFVQFIIY
jgi:hypothetical protein